MSRWEIEMKRFYAGILTVLLIATVVGCDSASSDYYIVKSADVKQGGFWCDGNHMANSYWDPPEGNHRRAIYFDVHHVDQGKPILLTSDPQDKYSVFVRGCENNVLLLSGETETDSTTSKHSLYFMNVDSSTPTLLLQDKDSWPDVGSRTVSLPGKYVVLTMPRNVVGETYVVDPECATYVRPGFKVVCLDAKDSYILALKHFVVTTYLWQDRVPARLSNGEFQDVKNPEAPMRDEQGQPILNAAFLRDLDGKILARLDKDSRYITSPRAYKIDPEQKYLYSPCKAATNTKYSGDFERVCRYALDAPLHQWEEIFSFDLVNKVKFGIQEISVDASGNVYFDMPGLSGKNGGIWKYDAAQKNIVHVVVASDAAADHGIDVSPDGKTVAFLRDSIPHLAYPREMAQ